MRRQDRCEMTLVECESMPSSANTQPARGEPPESGPARPATSPVRKSRVARVEQTAGKLAVAIEPSALCAIFGVADAHIATRLLAQLVSVIQPIPDKPVDVEVFNQALALIEGIRPTDALEAMTATLLVAAHHAALDTMRRETHPDQTPGGRALYGALALKAMSTYARLLEALSHGRGKGVIQQIIVKRVSVEPGGQAVVGSVKIDRGRGSCETRAPIRRTRK